jgi:hypothetical protein
MDRTKTLDRLSGAVQAAGLTEDSFSRLARFPALSPQERRLLTFLEGCTALVSTPEVRAGAGVSNVSQVAIDLSGKLRAMQDPRQVLCLRRQVLDREGRPIQLGFWSLVTAEAANDSRC